MENYFFSSPPASFQLERGTLLPGFMVAQQAERFVWVFPLSQYSELPSPCRGWGTDGEMAETIVGT